MTAKQIEKETKSKLKDYYTKEEIYNIFKDFLKECMQDKSNTLSTFTTLKLEEKFYQEAIK